MGRFSARVQNCNFIILLSGLNENVILEKESIEKARVGHLDGNVIFEEQRYEKCRDGSLSFLGIRSVTGDGNC